MSVLFIVVPLALLLVGAAIVAFVWAARRGQFDDVTTPAIRAVVDDADEPGAVVPPPAGHAGRGLNEGVVQDGRDARPGGPGR